MKKFLSTIFYCLSLSWRASKYYTILRLLGIITPVNGILSSFLLKYILDLLSGAYQQDNRIFVLVLLVGGSTGAAGGGAGRRDPACIHEYAHVASRKRHCPNGAYWEGLRDRTGKNGLPGMVGRTPPDGLAASGPARAGF